VIAEHGYEGAASADQDQQAQAGRPLHRRQARRQGNGVTTVATPFE
jgi:hypothetical protein